MHLARLAEELGEMLAGSGQRPFSYVELEEQSNRIAHVFAELGVRPGGHVASCSN
jgi:long-chain acyl-CoA synthetase